MKGKRLANVIDPPEENGNGNGHSVALAERPPKTKGETKPEAVVISRPNIRRVVINITGTAPYLQCAFPLKAKNAIMTKQQAGDVGNTAKKTKRAARDYDEDFKGSLHVGTKGGYGIPASAFRAAAISACRVANFKMTVAKLSIFVKADDYDAGEGTPLVNIVGKPEKHIMMGRNANGSCDVRVRGIFKEWKAAIQVEFDADQFSLEAVFNLFARMGWQVGIGEGRPDSRNSAGMGLGTFSVDTDEQ